MNYLLKNTLLFPLNVLYGFGPKTVLRFLFIVKQGYKLNLNNPETYNEKLQWMKLNYNDLRLPKLVDKFTVREYVGERCPEILNQLLWHGFYPKEIPWDTLPDKFVIKVTHGSGLNIICQDKKSLDKKKIEKKLEKWLKTKYIKCYGEWFYGVEKPRIIIEHFLDDGSGTTPIDYKILCFNGEPAFFITDTNRFQSHKRNIYDKSWTFLQGVTLDFPNDHEMDKPKEVVYNGLLNYARILSKGFPHARVDFYVIQNTIYFGEITFTYNAGFGRFNPRQFDYELGKIFILPENNMVKNV